jgi:hypothetical protein
MPAYNMGFSALLADKYVLIIPFAYLLQSGLDEKSRSIEFNSNYINFTQLRFGVANHRIPAQ